MHIKYCVLLETVIRIRLVGERNKEQQKQHQARLYYQKGTRRKYTINKDEDEDEDE